MTIEFGKELTDKLAVLDIYRHVMNRIHQGGNIYYDNDRMEAYAMIAKLASDLRKASILPNIF